MSASELIGWKRLYETEPTDLAISALMGHASADDMKAIVRGLAAVAAEIRALRTTLEKTQE